MRNLRKAVAALLVFVMVIGTVAFAAPVPEDVIGTQYEEAVTTLAALDILEGRDTGEFDPEGDITRAEFAAVAIRALGLEESVPAAAYEPTAFTDCGSDVQWAWGYINLASKQGIINGYGDGTFGPTDPVTYEQAVAMLVRILGYEVFAQQKGGWPDGYLVVAAENKITSGVPVGGNNEPANRGTVAMLTYNCLEVNLAEASYIDSNGNTVTVVVNKTLLEDKLEVTKKYGILVSTDLSAVEGSKNIDGEISFRELSGNSYLSKETAKIGETNPYDLLGYAVVYYLKYDKTRDEYTAISVQEDTVRNNSLTVAAEDLADSTLSTFRYWEDKLNDEEPTEERLDATILVNGVIQNSPTDAMLRPETGSVTIVDNDGDDVYEVAFVKQYLNFVVDSVNTDRNYIDFKGGKSSLKLDPADSDTYKYSITLDGEAIELADLKEYDVLSVIADVARGEDIGNGPSSDPTFETAQIFVTRNVVNGTVDELDSDSVYILDEEGTSTEYDFGAGFTGSDISLGDEGAFYLDYEGKIAYADTTTVLDNYAYVSDAYASGGSRSAVTTLRLLTTSGDLVEVNTTKYVQLNGTRTRSINEDTFAPVIEGGQLIAYELNSSGYISSIDTALDNTTDSTYLREFSLDYVDESARYNNGLFARQFIVNSDTVVFEIPLDEDEEDMSVRDMSAFSNDNNYNIEIYDVDRNGYAGVIVYRPTAGSEKMSSQLALIKKISATTVDHQTVDRLTAYQMGSEIRMTTTDTSVFASAYSDTAIKNEIKNAQGLDNASDPTETVGYGDTAKNYGEWNAAYNIAYNFFPGNLILFSQNSNGEIDSALKIYPAEAPGLIGFDDEGNYEMIPYMAYDNQFNPRNNDVDLEIIAGTVTERTPASNSFVVASAQKNPEIAVEDPNNFYMAFEPANARVIMDSNTKVYYVDTSKYDADADVQTRDNSISYIDVGDKVVVRKKAGDVLDVVVYRNYDVSIYNSLFIPNDNA